MSRRILAFIFCLYMPSALAEAKDGHQEEVRVLKQWDLENQGQAVVLVKEGGHIVGQPFQVELRADCHGKSKDFQDWEVRDSFSVCDLKPDSLKINRQQTAVAVKTKSVDLKDYNQQVDEGILHPVVKCQEATDVRKFSLKNLCHKH